MGISNTVAKYFTEYLGSFAMFSILRYQEPVV